jgi:hypothetical protein
MTKPETEKLPATLIEALERAAGPHNPYDKRVAVLSESDCRLVLSALRAQGGGEASPWAKAYAEIDSAPEALRRLGDWLCNVLDEDHFATANRMVIGAMMETSASIRALSRGVPEGST